MGTWSTEIFGNDDAFDFLGSLKSKSDYSFIEAEIDGMPLLGSEYIDLDNTNRVLAAAEVIAQALGHSKDTEYPADEIAEWLELDCKQPMPEGLVDKAIMACKRVLEPPSEILDVWFDPDDLDEWRQNVLDLIERLNAAKAGVPG